MSKRNIIVIGASAGGMEALKILVSHLPAELNASIFIVWHMSPDVKGILPDVLNKLGKLHAAHGVDCDHIEPNRIYVAPPDRHLLIERDRIRVTHGPKENRFRPAVDPLFRSAAYAYGNRVIGVVLSGALDDGAAGLWTIKHYGGIAIVQNPEEAEFSSMPESALRNVDVDYKETAANIASRLISLSQELIEEKFNVDQAERDKTKLEVLTAMQNEEIKNKILQFGQMSSYTCPECHGVLSIIKDGDILRFRCHTGHAFSADTLLSALSENIESSLWSVIRGVEETVMLLNTMGDHYAAMNLPKIAGSYFRKAKETESRMVHVRKSVLSNEHLSVDIIEQEVKDHDLEIRK